MTLDQAAAKLRDMGHTAQEKPLTEPNFAEQLWDVADAIAAIPKDFKQLLDDQQWRWRWHERLGRGLTETEGSFYERIEALAKRVGSPQPPTEERK